MFINLFFILGEGQWGIKGVEGTEPKDLILFLLPLLFQSTSHRLLPDIFFRLFLLGHIDHVFN